MIELVESASADERLRAAAAFVRAAPAGAELLLVGASRDAIDDLVRALSAERAATFGLHRFTLTQLAARLAAPALSAAGLATCTRLGAEAVAARATFEVLGSGAIPYFAPVARCPGFGATLAATVAELRGAGVDPARLRAPGGSVAQLGVLLAAYEAQLAAAGLADRATLLQAAAAAVGGDAADPLTRMPLLLLDVPIDTAGERALLAALCAAAPHGLATLPAGDRRGRAAFTAIGARPHPAAAPAATNSLARLQRYLFAQETPPPGAPDDAVRFLSAPGEGRETVEIARRILAEARGGTPFDRMVVFLRSPEAYTARLEAAFQRAGVAAYFARGTRRPNLAGRAFLALLACALDGLSARRFAEYLSFGQVPQPATDGTPPVGEPDWQPPRDESLGFAGAGEAAAAAESAPAESAVVRALNAPWKWEELLSEAAVIGGAERWRRRLDGLAHELAAQRDMLERDEPEAPRLAGIGRQLEHLAALRRFALPVVELLAALPAAAAWDTWLARLSELAPRVLRQPEGVLQALAELAPMAAVGPVGLDEVHGVLADRLRFLTDEPPAHRYGRVLVATLEQARGRSFDVVFVPGLAERVFPQRPREDPLLLDALRRALSADLPTQDDRVERERLLLRLAVGAAERRLYLSYPRVDVVQGRPRVTSFYGLDVARATHGGIPDVEAFERAAARLGDARLAWPAPALAADAIDAAEHDLATLDRLLHAAPGARVDGGAQYLVELNPHLARALRSRFWRWERPRWSELDGMVRSTPETAEALAGRRLTARPYSPSALERYAVCPYRFYLASIVGLERRTPPTPLAQLDPLTRGKLFHRVQADTLRGLAAAGALPVTAATLPAAEPLLARTLEAVAARLHDELAPPIRRVWEDEIAALRGDLLYWLRHLAEHSDVWHPAYFELGFGLRRDAERDPRSLPDPVVLAGGAQLRGAVDLIERRAGGGALRVTDHKTGAERGSDGLVIGGGEMLQPVLYGLAVEAALETPVSEARLFYCTARGGFAERVVPLDARARAQGHEVLALIDQAIASGFLPPAPREGACAHCDFRSVCGPHEEERVRRKEAPPLAALAALRQRP